MVSTSDFDSDSTGSIPVSVANWSADEPMGVTIRCEELESLRHGEAYTGMARQAYGGDACTTCTEGANEYLSHITFATSIQTLTAPSVLCE